MLTPQSCPQELKHQDCTLAKQFSLLVWNVYKKNQNVLFQEKLKKLLLDKPSDFLLFQEVKYPKAKFFHLEDYSYVLASNMETKKQIYGVLTASKACFESITCNLTKGKELGIATHKSFLISQHPLRNGQSLYIINIHAINFVSSKKFEDEMQAFKKILLNYKGPMIVVGDFNNWNKKRVSILKTFQNELGLSKAEPENLHFVKHVFNKPLDHIFYRGLDLLKAEAIHIKNASDHNPLYARFQIQELKD
ncbi:MAG: hypothetical protein COA44_02475 [Arcobacter sp.]|nr:MAG: hypothetical protein COA44_02475 [Arcobacter sp.]